MKWILALALLSIVLVSGCIQSGMLTGGEGDCIQENTTIADVYRLEGEVLSAGREILWSENLGYYAEATVRLENTDKEAGWFLMTFEWQKPGAAVYIDKKNLHIEPGETGEFKSAYPVNPQQGAEFVYSYTSYPDSGRTENRQVESC